MSMNKVANYYYELGRRDAFSKIAAGGTGLPADSILALIAENSEPDIPGIADQVGINVPSGLKQRLTNALGSFPVPDFSDLGNKGLNYLKGVGNTALDYAKDNPYKTGLGALGLAGGAYGAKKLYDYLNHEEEPTTQEKMLALAKQYGPQAAAALAATGALYGGYRAMKSRDRD